MTADAVPVEKRDVASRVRHRDNVAKAECASKQNELLARIGKMEAPYPYDRPKQVAAATKEIGPLPFMIVSFLLAAPTIASAALFVWAANYWLHNTPVFGRPLVPPAISPGVSSLIILSSLIATGVFLFFTIATARESLRRWYR